jgi:hypothetical protein
MIAPLRNIEFIPDAIYIDLNFTYFNNRHNFPMELLKMIYPNSLIYDIKKCPKECITVPQDPEPINRESGVSKDAYIFLREILLKCLKDYKPLNTYSEYIYISRLKDSYKRKIINEDILIKRNEFKHFQILTMSALPLMEQLYIFYNAKVIITSHGAALVNILVCNKDCRIIEITTQKMSNLKHFEDIANTLNLNYNKFLDVTEVNSHHDLYEANMLLNTDSLYKLI